MLIHFLVPVLLLGAAAILLLFGESRILNFVDYKEIDNPRALNRYAGKATLIFATISGTITYYAWHYPKNQDILALAYVPVVLGLIITLAVGAERFKAPPKRRQ